MKQILYFLSACLMTLVQSCSSDQDSMYLDPTSQESEISHMVVKFEGRTYETDVKTVGDSVVYLNEEYAEVYRTKIVDNSEIATMISSDEAGITHVKYYKTEEELLRSNRLMPLSIGKESIEIIDGTTRSVIANLTPTGIVIGTAVLYQNTNHGGDRLIVGMTTMSANGVGNLKDFGFNDKISSIKLINEMSPNTEYTIWYHDLSDNNIYKRRIFRGSQILPVLICYRNTGFKGKALYCVANPTGSGTDHLDENLKKLGFNDIISSLELALIEKAAYDKGELEGIIYPHQ